MLNTYLLVLDTLIFYNLVMFYVIELNFDKKILWCLPRFATFDLL